MVLAIAAPEGEHWSPPGSRGFWRRQLHLRDRVAWQNLEAGPAWVAAPAPEAQSAGEARNHRIGSAGVAGLVRPADLEEVWRLMRTYNVASPRALPSSQGARVPLFYQVEGWAQAVANERGTVALGSLRPRGATVLRSSSRLPGTSRDQNCARAQVTRRPRSALPIAAGGSSPRASRPSTARSTRLSRPATPR
eukprot:TRINITY_DN67474_c0_g1_i1.p1 TRINITY_DN67474_c0_g1~~TRINITY_DN67474_c0_g1_i1.p1  ORF type:complete len:193 (+),score=20.62 TRINITY_DN67474_c0_g1_i1:33-611(+)